MEQSVQRKITDVPNLQDSNRSTIALESAVLYARVSSREQAEEGYSLDHQVRLSGEYAERHNFKIVKKFVVPESASGFQERKIFKEMMEYVRKQKIHIIICEKVDRITRNFKEAILVDDWRLENNVNQIHFWKENLMIHKDSRSHEIMQWDFRIVMAKQYSLNLSEEVRKGLGEKALSGWYPGSRKRGYLSIRPEGSKKAIWVLDKSAQSEAPFIKKAFELYGYSNYSLKEVRRKMFEEGWKIKNGKPIPKSAVAFILNDPFYCGRFVWRGKEYKGNHEALISEELFDIVKEKLHKKNHAKYRKHNFLLRSLVHCGECGYSITGELQKGHVYYRCTRFKGNCSQRKYIREEEIEKQILDFFNEIEIRDKELFDWLVRTLKESHADEMAYHNQVLSSFNQQYQQLQTRLDNLYMDKLDGRITAKKYEELDEKWRKEQEQVRKALEKHEKSNINYFELGSKLLEVSKQAKNIYLKKKLEEKRQLLNLVFSNLTLKDGILKSIEDIVATVQS
jgi:site-specific DNA recombinase